MEAAQKPTMNHSLNRLRQRAGDALAVVFIVVIGVLTLGGLTPYGSATTPDSVSYLDIASHVRAGDGWRATDFALATGVDGGTVENRLWPPLYPALLALFAGHAADVAGAATLGTVLFAVTGLLAYALLRRGLAILPALLASLCVLLSTPLLTSFSYAWSEALYIPLLLLAALSALLYRDHRAAAVGVRAALIGLLVASLAAAVLTRYIGLHALVILPCASLFGRRDGADHACFVVGAGVYVLGVGGVLLQNYRVAGTVSGGPRAPSELSWLQNFQHVADSVLTALPQSSVAFVVTAVVALGGAFALSRFAGLHVEAAASRGGRESHALVGLMGLVAASYLVALVVLRTRTQFDEIDVRLVAPAWAPVLIACALLAGRMARRGAAGLVAASLCLAVPVGSAVSGVRLHAALTQQWATDGRPAFPRRGLSPYNNFTRDPARNVERRLIAEEIPAGAFLVTDSPAVWRFVSGRQTLELPRRPDAQVRERLGRLPAGSALMLEKSAARAYFARMGVPTSILQGADLGGVVLVRVSPEWAARAP